MSTKYNKLDNKVSRRYSINNVKINPFAILNDNNDNNINSQNNNIHDPKLNELIRKYKAKSYLLPAQRKLVEEELERRNMKVNKDDFPILNNTKSNNDNFPILISNTKLNNIKSENTPIKFIEQTFKDIITNTNNITNINIKQPEPILINVKPKSEIIKTDESILNIPNTINTEETKNSNPNIKLSNKTVNTQPVDFIKNLCNIRKHKYNERKLYKAYLHEKLYKEYAKPMSFHDWCEFKNDIQHQEYIEMQREKEKYNIVSSSDEDKFDDDYNIEDIENHDNNNEDEYNNDE